MERMKFCFSSIKYSGRPKIINLGSRHQTFKNCKTNFNKKNSSKHQSTLLNSFGYKVTIKSKWNDTVFKKP